MTALAPGQAALVATVLQAAEYARVAGVALPADLARDVRWVGVLAKYDPDQPRDPAGTPTGGQWTDDSAAGGAAASNPYVSDAFKAKWQKYGEPYLDEIAEQLGMTPEQYRQACTEHIKKLLSESGLTPRVRVEEVALERILADGRFKTFAETSYKGQNERAKEYKRVRYEFEQDVFGIPLDQKEGRPVYGYLGSDQHEERTASYLEHYGDVIVKLKDTVLDRATITLADSLDNIDSQYISRFDPDQQETGKTMIPLPARSPDYRVGPHFFNGEEVKTPLANRDWKDLTTARYVELQYHGGLKASDIESVIFTTAPSPALQAKLAKRGISWEHRPEFKYDWKKPTEDVFKAGWSPWTTADRLRERRPDLYKDKAAGVWEHVATRTRDGLDLFSDPAGMAVLRFADGTQRAINLSVATIMTKVDGAAWELAPDDDAEVPAEAGSVLGLGRAKAWDESKHPRDPKGSETGGQFTEAASAPSPAKKPYQIRRRKPLNLDQSDDEIASEIQRRVPSDVSSIYDSPLKMPGRLQSFGFFTPDGRAIVAEAHVDGYHEDWVGGPDVLNNLLDRGFVRFARLYGKKYNELNFSTNRPLTASVRDELSDWLIAHPEVDVNFDIGNKHGTRRDLERMLGIGEKAALPPDPLDAERRDAEDMLAAGLYAYFARQWRALRKQLAAAKTRLQAARLGRQALGILISLDWGAEEGRLLATLGPVLEDVLSDAARLAWGELTGLGVNLSWDIYDTAASAWAKQYRYDLIRDLTASTREQLGKTVSQWIASDQDFAELTEQVRRIVPPAPKPVLRDRARLIAQTETTRVYAESRNIALTQAGLKTFTWQTANDELVCPKCGPLHGKTGIVGQGVLNEDDGQYYDQPAHPGCRCWKTASVAELEANVAVKHYGPGPHPSGSPQSVHGHSEAGAAPEPADLELPLTVASSPTAFLVKLELEDAKLPDGHTDGLDVIEFTEQTYVGYTRADGSIGEANGVYSIRDRTITLASNAPRGGNIEVFGGATVLHEIGHHVHIAKLTDEAAERWAALSRDGERALISAYARNNRGEHFAEAYRLYARGGDYRRKLKNLEPDSYKFMQGLFKPSGSPDLLPAGQFTDYEAGVERYGKRWQ